MTTTKEKIGIITGIIVILGALWAIGSWLDDRWALHKEFDAFAQTAQQTMQKTNEALEKTNMRIDFQRLKDELKFTQERIAKIKDDHKDKLMPQSVKDLLRDLQFKEQDLTKTLDNFYPKAVTPVK